MVERGGLENRCARERTVGSNPTLSATLIMRVAATPTLAAGSEFERRSEPSAMQSIEIFVFLVCWLRQLRLHIGQRPERQWGSFRRAPQRVRCPLAGLYPGAGSFDAVEC